MSQTTNDGSVTPMDGPDPRDWLAAIIDGSEDAIISKDLSGNIQSWNPSATRMFGYEPEEVIGKPITLLIPHDRTNEEPRILSEIKAGRRVQHFETVRRRKDGSQLELSLTISPVRNIDGIIVGASKIARDITERRLAEERQCLLLGEMHHRVKNLFAVTSAIVSLSGRAETTPQALAQTIRAKLSALARAHELTVAHGQMVNDSKQGRGDLLALIQAVLEPYRVDDRICIEGDPISIGAKAATSVALLIYELATNSAKYGALSTAEGRLVVRCQNGGESTRIDWAEYGSPSPPSAVQPGFGTQLETSMATALRATITRDWKSTGLVAAIEIPLATFDE